ncbi:MULTISPECIES: hypothetical protein [Gilliamella]|uniref:DUF1311 domain-containing protein n=1 Tax=Gilliamella apicola TaxID=1196095 RepID=A0A556SUN2_9GAMM|nr:MULTISPECIES: hypothetical protein [Gilliamella]MBI0096548.1 hypothetical protein [Gilliamella sp. W8136]TSK04840.1 hypothetical protein FPQ15_03245 [Gilliamella apicola]
MDITLSHFYKLLNKFLFIFFLNCIASQAMAKNIHDCDLTWIADHPIKECTDLYEKKISSLTVTQKQYFEDEFKKILNHKVLWVVSEKLAYLFKDYPTSIVLFTKLQIDEKVDKANKDDTTKVSFGDPVSWVYGNYEFILQQYKILSHMLEKKGKLETEEKNMLSISKQRTQCLGDVLDDLSQNFEKSVDRKFIIDKCYQ